MRADTRPQTPPRRSFSLAALPLLRAHTEKLQEQKEVCLGGWGGKEGPERWEGEGKGRRRMPFLPEPEQRISKQEPARLSSTPGLPNRRLEPRSIRRASSS